MIQLYQRLDLRPIGIPQTLRLSQYDSDFEIIFKLENFDGTWTVDDSTTAEVQGTKTDGHGYSADAVFDYQECTVTVEGDVQMTAAAGRNVFEVVLFHDGDRLGSKNFILDVERAALDAETTASDSKIKNFTEMVDAAEDAAETATAAAEAAEEAAATFSTDTTLTISGKAADAKATGDAIANIVPGLSNEAKEALLDCFQHVAWIDDQGPNCYEALEVALNPSQIVSISADFEQGQNVISASDQLDDLIQFLTVTALYSDGETKVVSDGYTLSGTLAAGESSVTVAYKTFTTTFDVNVKGVPTGYTEKSYVQTNGTQYIASGIYETDLVDTWTRYKASVSGEHDRAGHIFSSTNEYTPYARYFAGNGAHKTGYSHFGSQALTTDVQTDMMWTVDVPYTLESYKEDGKVYYNDVLAIAITEGTTMSASNQMYFFTFGGNPTNTTYRFYGNLYYFKIFSATGAKLHDFVPCRNSSNVAGLYDLVTDTFLAPTAGTLVTD